MGARIGTSQATPVPAAGFDRIRHVVSAGRFAVPFPGQPSPSVSSVWDDARKQGRRWGGRHDPKLGGTECSFSVVAVQTEQSTGRRSPTVGQRTWHLLT